MTATAGTITIRVRYPECDPMNVAHHAAYLAWFEMGRTELLRESGASYRDLEAAGVFLAVVAVNVKYARPARYDDLLTLRTTLMNVSHVKIEHAYELLRPNDADPAASPVRLATATTTLACLDADGAPRPVPELLRLPGT